MASTMAEMELYDKMPYNPEAEQSVLGAVLIAPDTLPEVMGLISADCFYRRENRELFSVMVAMFSAGEVIDPVTVLEGAVRGQVFPSAAEGKVYIAELVQVVPTSGNVLSYAKIVQDKYYLRRLIGTAQEIIDKSSDGQTDSATLLDNAEQKIYEIRQGRDTRGLTRFSEVMIGVYDQLQKLSGEDKEDARGVDTGFVDLDNKLLGMNRSDLVLLAARPAMGKTSFALNIAVNVAKKTGKAVAVFSLEMPREQVALRMLSGEASVSSAQLRTGELSPEDWIRLSQGAAVLSEKRIYIDDTSTITVPEIKAKLRRVKDLGFVVIDYLQLVSGSGRSENRVQEVSAMTRGLKIMAKELDVPIMVLSQLNRASETRSDHRPMLSDLRESGSIEQDADMVLMLYRDVYGDERGENNNAAECIIAKNRHGSTGTVPLTFDGQYTRFGNAAVVQYE